MGKIKTAPKGLAILALVGPGLVWCSEMIGSGEVIITTRAGAILGISVMWAIVFGIFLKFWIGLGGAYYTVCTGEGMIDMFDRMPGPRHWVVGLVFVIQFISATVAMGSLASAAGVFISNLTHLSPQLCGWIVSLLALFIVWSGGFKILKIIMSLFVLIIILGVLYVALTVFPDLSTFLKGFLLRVPEVPEWALEKAGTHANPWREILPLMGWAAGGFASQVWYTYWVLGEGYGVANGRGYGKSADLIFLKDVKQEDARNIKGWCRIVYTDATVALSITIILTLSFLIAGAGILRPNQLAPEGTQVALTLSTIFSSKWGVFGSYLFILSGAAALGGTLMVQLAGWPRLFADCLRILVPKIQNKLDWKHQFRTFLIFFFLTNMIIVFWLGFRPVFLVKMGAVLDGLLLTPLQALWVAVGLFWVMPRLFNHQSYSILKPSWPFALFLIIAFLLFGYFCLFQIPHVL